MAGHITCISGIDSPMALILAIEPDAAQAATLREVIRDQVRARLVLVDSKNAALSALEDGVSDLILVSALLPPHEEDELAAHLRTLEHAAHLQTLTIPQLTLSKKGSARKKGRAQTKRSLFKRRAPRESVVGCDPTAFAKEVASLGLIRFRGHFPKGGYDVHDGQTNQEPATPPGV